MPFATGLTYRDGVPITYDAADYGRPSTPDRAAGYATLAHRAGGRRGSARRSASGSAPTWRGRASVPSRARTGTSIPSGVVFVDVGVGAQGQAHETTLAQICADELPAGRARGRRGRRHGSGRFGMGTIASRVAAVAGRRWRARPARSRTRRGWSAAEMLECAPKDVVVADGTCGWGRRRTSGSRLGAGRARRRPEPRAGEDRRARARRLRLLLSEQRHLGLRRPGRRGGGGSRDVHARAAAPRGRARLRARRSTRWSSRARCTAAPPRDRQRAAGGDRPRRPGQLLTGSFMDYALPRADYFPSIDVVHLEFPSASQRARHQGRGRERRHLPRRDDRRGRRGRARRLRRHHRSHPRHSGASL